MPVRDSARKTQPTLSPADLAVMDLEFLRGEHLSAVGSSEPWRQMLRCVASLAPKHGGRS
jgi:hypothetical protein